MLRLCRHLKRKSIRTFLTGLIDEIYRKNMIIYVSNSGVQKKVAKMGDYLFPIRKCKSLNSATFLIHIEKHISNPLMPTFQPYTRLGNPIRVHKFRISCSH